MNENEQEYEDLHEVISMEGFDYQKYYLLEDTLLRPRMEEKGYYAVTFSDGERDSFGPLTRVVTAIDKDGVYRKFIYG